jgi:hypothetical protein
VLLEEPVVEEVLEKVAVEDVVEVVDVLLEDVVVMFSPYSSVVATTGVVAPVAPPKLKADNAVPHPPKECRAVLRLSTTIQYVSINLSVAATSVLPPKLRVAPCTPAPACQLAPVFKLPVNAQDVPLYFSVEAK